MRVGILALAVGAGLSLSSLASADIVYTVEDRFPGGVGMPGSGGDVDLYSRSSGLASTKLTAAQIYASILAQNPGIPLLSTEVRLAEISPGPNGDFLIAHGQATGRGPNSFGVGAVLRASNLAGVASVTTVSSSGDLSNPIGVAYDASTNSAVLVNNPGGGGPGPFPYYDGVINANLTTGTQTRIFEEPGGAFPRYQAGAYIQSDPRGLARTFLVGSQQGGLNAPPGNGAGGPQLYRLNYDQTLTSSTMTRIVDFTNPAETGIAEDFIDGTLDFFTNGGIRGIAVVPGSDSIYVAMRHNGIWKVNLDAAGNYDLSNPMTQILAPQGILNPGDFGLVNAMEYDYLANKLVFAMDTLSGTGLSGLWEMNLDGSGRTRLVADVAIRGIDIIPAPGAAALLGLGALVAGRRRRN